jgi:hypothetical protein
MADASLDVGLARVERKLYDIVSAASMSRIRREGGAAGKESAHDAAAAKLGGDRAMSGFKRGRVRLGARYDERAGAAVDVNLTPKGGWVLADEGRRGVAGPMKPIVPRKRSGAKALSTPWGPRASVRSSRSRGLGVVDDAVSNMRTTVPRAAFRQLQREIGREFRG